jgi:hypothetical protein
VSFQLEAVAARIAARIDKWTGLGLACDTRPISPTHGKSVVVVDFRSAAWLAEILVWDTGEAELGTTQMPHRYAVPAGNGAGDVSSRHRTSRAPSTTAWTTASSATSWSLHKPGRTA